MQLAKVWTAIERLSIIWKLAYREKARQELHKNIMSCIELILEETSHKTVVVRPPTSYL